MKRLLAGMLAGLVGAGFPRSSAAQISTARAAAPVYLRTQLAVGAPSSSGTRCLSDCVESPLSIAQARNGTVKVIVYARPPQGAANPPLDKTPHKLRLVMAGSYYATDAPTTLVRTGVSTIRGQQVSKLATLLPTPGQGQRPYDLYNMSVSVNGWPTLHTSTVRVTP